MIYIVLIVVRVAANLAGAIIHGVFELAEHLDRARRERRSR